MAVVAATMIANAGRAAADEDEDEPDLNECEL